MKMSNIGCSCCTGELTYSLDDLNRNSQVLPADDSFLKTTPGSSPYPDDDGLISYGNVPFDPFLNISSIIGDDNKTRKVSVKNLLFGESHSGMLLAFDDEPNTTMLYGYGSNENGQLGIDYKVKRNIGISERNPTTNSNDICCNSYPNWTEISIESTINHNTFSKRKYYIDQIAIGNGFSMVVVYFYEEKSYGLYRFMLKKETKFDLLYNNDIENPNNKITNKHTVFVENFDINLYKGGKQICVYNDLVVLGMNSNKIFMKGTLYNMKITDQYILYADKPYLIKQMTMGINSCGLGTEENYLFGFGHNEYGEFGQLDDNDVEDDDFNDYFVRHNLKIKKLVTGARHSGVLGENGQVYCFGDNSDGQCCGGEKIVTTPKGVEIGEYEEEEIKIIDIWCGFNHSIAQSESGRIFLWGDSAWNKLGVSESRTDQYIPMEAKELKTFMVQRVFAGPMQTSFYVRGGK